MNALLDHADLSAITGRAIAAGLALPPRDALFMGIDNAVRSMVYSQDDVPADALMNEVDRLNTFIDRTETNGYHFAVWLKNAADKLDVTKPTEAQFFRAMADKVAAIPPAPKAGPANTRDVITGAKAEEQSNQMVASAVHFLRLSMPGLSLRATNLMVSKRVHDALHKVQLQTLPMWQDMMKVLKSDPGFARATLAAQVQQLTDASEALPAEFSFLDQTEPLCEQAQATTDWLKAEGDAAKAALAADDMAALRTVMDRVADAVKIDMQNYAEGMEIYRAGLDLAELGTNLTLMAEHSANAALRDNATRLASKLAEITQDLNVIGPRHKEWQSLDEGLANLEQLFGFLPSGPAVYSAFDIRWAAVEKAIASLSPDLRPDRFDGVRVLRDQFLAACPVPVTAPPSADAAKAFASFVKALRTVFQTVDKQLLKICNQLGNLTSQLAQL